MPPVTRMERRWNRGSVPIYRPKSKHIEASVQEAVFVSSLLLVAQHSTDASCNIRAIVKAISACVGLGSISCLGTYIAASVQEQPLITLLFLVASCWLNHPVSSLFAQQGHTTLSVVVVWEPLEH